MRSSEELVATYTLLTVGMPFAATVLTLFFRPWRTDEPEPVLRRQERILGIVTPVSSFFSLVLSFLLAHEVASPGFEAASFSLGPLSFHVDALSAYFVLIVNLVGFFASVCIRPSIRRAMGPRAWKHEPALFHFLFNAFHVTMLAVPLSDDLVVLWMAVELTTLTSTLLVGYRRRRRPVEAAWKYIILTTAGIVFALLGTVLLANALCSSSGECNTTTDLKWSELVKPEIVDSLDQDLVVLSFLFILIGYGAKAGLAPVHTWLPDGHGQAPSEVSALLSGVLLNCALYAILRFYTITNLRLHDQGAFTSNLLLATGLMSLLIAVPMILKTNTFKRVLAYHSLEHMGIISFGLGLASPLALFGALFHILNHALTKALMFLTFERIRRVYRLALPKEDEAAVDPDELDAYLSPNTRGVLSVMPAHGAILLLGGLALVGSPPFNIFLSEFIIIWATVEKITNTPMSDWAGLLIYVSAAVLFVTSLMLIFGGLVRHLSRLLLGKPPAWSFAGVGEHWLRTTSLLVLLGLVLLLGVCIPSFYIDLPKLLTHSANILQCAAITCPGK